jgi:hypothetical protein
MSTCLHTLMAYISPARTAAWAGPDIIVCPVGATCCRGGEKARPYFLKGAMCRLAGRVLNATGRRKELAAQELILRAEVPAFSSRGQVLGADQLGGHAYINPESSSRYPRSASGAHSDATMTCTTSLPQHFLLLPPTLFFFYSLA